MLLQFRTTQFPCFNLKREAAPVATVKVLLRNPRDDMFQSQTRSRPSCHCDCLAPLLEQRDGCICEADGFGSFKTRDGDPLKKSILFRGLLCKSLRSATGTFLPGCEAACLQFAPLPASHISLQQVDTIFMGYVSSAKYFDSGLAGSTQAIDAHRILLRVHLFE
jgi:hypothetical protein